MKILGIFLKFAAAAMAMTSALACSQPPMDEVELRVDSQPPVSVEVRPELVSIPHGIAVAVTVVPVAANEVIAAQVTMESSERSVLGVEPISENFFILYGTFPGDSTLRIIDTSTSAQVDVPAKVIDQLP
jgi:hypothetical protein